MSTTMRAKWHPPPPPPPPSPRILHLPRRHRRKRSKTPAGRGQELRRIPKGQLSTLFDRERTFHKTVPVVLLNSISESERRECVFEEEEIGESEGGFEEDKWRFQAEILRAECNFLRMEREFALKKLERNRVQQERTLRSAVQTLISGREKIFEGKSASRVLDEEIEELAEKLQALQKTSAQRDSEFRKCDNFDKRAILLQRRLEKLRGASEQNCMKEIQEVAKVSLSINASYRVDGSPLSNHHAPYKVPDMEILKKKMEGLSKGMLLERMEEFGSMLSTTISTSSPKRFEFPDLSSSSIGQQYQETMSYENNRCSGHCKVIVQRVIEQVRAETEQWSQMQQMLARVREEMEELQASRDFWEGRAFNSDYQVRSLSSSEKLWRQKAFSSEAMVNELQAEVAVLHGELERLWMDQKKQVMGTKGTLLVARDTQVEKEKRVLFCSFKENHDASCIGRKQETFTEGRRKTYTSSSGLMAQTVSPFRDIGNLWPPPRQNSKSIFPWSPPTSRKDFEN